MNQSFRSATTVSRIIRLSFALAAVTSLLAACAPSRRTVVIESPGSGDGYGSGQVATPAGGRIPGGSYQVVKGDTLYSIAFRNGVDFRSLASWNGIAEPYTIWPGQVLRLAPEGTTGASASAASAPVGESASAAKPAASSGTPAASASPSAAAPVFESVPAKASSQQAATQAAASTTSTASVATAAALPAASASTSTAHQPPSATVAKAATVSSPAPAASTAASGGVPAVAVPVAGAPTAAPEAAKTPVLAGGGPARQAGGVSWRWPADGSLVKRFQSGDAIPGIEIAGKAGDPVRAAADGIVVYSGNGLVGYGELIIIKHNDSLLSAYGHNRKRLVKEGQKVSAGQQIAEMGATGATRDELQFQVRRDGTPVDPLSYLPAR